MQVIFHKINPKEYKLSLTRNDGTEDEMVLNYRELLKHDLIHFVVEKNAGLNHSFFGQAAKGQALASFLPKNPEYDPKIELGEMMVTEMIVGAIQGALKQGEIDADRLIEYMKLQEAEIPSYLDQAFLQAVMREVQVLIKWYDGLKVGEKLELEFFQNNPAKSYCAEPSTMATIFGKLNDLGK